MKTKYFLLIVCLLFSSVHLLKAQIIYTVPDGGWSYIYNGDVVGNNTITLDGTWSHENGSDQWDGSIIGEGNPGGAMILDNEIDTFIRVQDTGDPRSTVSASDPSNRKICFHHLLEDDGITSDSLLDAGITLAFRVRIPTDGILDDISDPDDNTQAVLYPGDGDGFLIEFYGKGMITIFQARGREQIGFSLTTDFDNELSVVGLVMNSLAGNAPIGGTGDVDFPSTSTTATINALYLDHTEWHEFWVQIKKDADAVGTNAIKIWIDGEDGPFEFNVTCGIATISEAETSYISFGSFSTEASGAMDLDYIAYKEGIIDPVSSVSGINNPVKDNFNFSLYPNPFNNKLRISADGIVNKITITNIMGVELTKTEVNNTDVILDLGKLKTGLYIIRIEGDKGFESRRIIKR